MRYEQAAALYERCGDMALTVGEKDEREYEAESPLRQHAATCYYAQAISLSEAKRYEDALAASEQATDADKTGWSGWDARGWALFNLKRYDEAADSYKKALDRSPPAKQAVNILRYQAQAENKQKRHKQAAKLHKQCGDEELAGGYKENAVTCYGN